jgi:hypothetical protein
VVPGHFSGTLFKIKTKKFISCYFYIYLITMMNFCKVPYSEDLESQENLKEEYHLYKNVGGFVSS